MGRSCRGSVAEKWRGVEGRVVDHGPGVWGKMDTSFFLVGGWVGGNAGTNSSICIPKPKGFFFSGVLPILGVGFRGVHGIDVDV